MAVKYLCDLCGKEIEGPDAGYKILYADSADIRVRIEVQLRAVKRFGSDRITEPLCCKECVRSAVLNGHF